jgi:hypothetical protein
LPVIVARDEAALIVFFDVPWGESGALLPAGPPQSSKQDDQRAGDDEAQREPEERRHDIHAQKMRREWND